MAVVMNQFQLFFALVFSFCLLLPLIQATDVKYCEKTDYGVKVSGVEISPYPVSRGKNTTFSIAASTGKSKFTERKRDAQNKTIEAHIEGNLCPAMMDLKSMIYIVDPLPNNLSFWERWFQHGIRAQVLQGEAISGGKLVIDVSYFGWQIHSETHDLCTETSCPVSIGDFVISHSQVLPGFTPPGSYTLKLTMVDGDKHQLTCFKFDFYIGFFEQSGGVAYA